MAEVLLVKRDRRAINVILDLQEDRIYEPEQIESIGGVITSRSPSEMSMRGDLPNDGRFFPAGSYMVLGDHTWAPQYHMLRVYMPLYGYERGKIAWDRPAVVANPSDDLILCEPNVKSIKKAMRDMFACFHPAWEEAVWYYSPGEMGAKHRLSIKIMANKEYADRYSGGRIKFARFLRNIQRMNPVESICSSINMSKVQGQEHWNVLGANGICVEQYRQNPLLDLPDGPIPFAPAVKKTFCGRIAVYIVGERTVAWFSEDGENVEMVWSNVSEEDFRSS